MTLELQGTQEFIIYIYYELLKVLMNTNQIDDGNTMYCSTATSVTATVDNSVN